MTRIPTLVLMTLLCIGCSTQSEQYSSGPNSDDLPLAGYTRKDIADADMSILFIGNSHSAGELSNIVAETFRREHPEFTVISHCATSGGFLTDHATNQSTLAILDKGPWDFVILQAQKYSTSGKYHYPYDGAIALTKRAQANGSGVLMFPEWGQRGNPDEGQRVHNLHEEIIQITGAGIAPIGLAWNMALKERPNLELHLPDGNHSTRLGAFLTANVIYSRITSKHPRELSMSTSSTETETYLERIAAEMVRHYVQSKARAEPKD